MPYGMGLAPFSTDSAAWDVTRGAAGYSMENERPSANFRWGLGATSGAISWWRVDSNGCGTYIDTKAGTKWWMVARRKGSKVQSFAEVMEFFESIYDADGQSKEIWDLEAVILPPRTRL